jgi:FkbM family methyltransferase
MLYYFHRLLYKLGIYKRINIIIKTTINNKKFRIPIINEFGYYHLLKHEEWFITLLKQLLPISDGVFADIGMNIGQTLLKVYSVDPGREYFGFEPNPICYYYCQRLIEVNNFKNYHLFPVGLFDKNDVVTLYMDMDIASGASVLKDFRTNMSRYKKHINVPVFKGEDILGKFQKKIGILKADAEGAELEVIKGTLKIVERDLPFLILEILPVYNSESTNGQYRKKRQDELVSILLNLEYSIFRINTDNGSLIKINDIEVHNQMENTNYLFVHASKTERLLEPYNIKKQISKDGSKLGSQKTNFKRQAPNKFQISN